MSGSALNSPPVVSHREQGPFESKPTGATRFAQVLSVSLRRLPQLASSTTIESPKRRLIAYLLFETSPMCPTRCSWSRMSAAAFSPLLYLLVCRLSCEEQFFLFHFTPFRRFFESRPFVRYSPPPSHNLAPPTWASFLFFLTFLFFFIPPQGTES